MLKERDRKRGARTKSEKEKKGPFLLFLTFRSRASLSISLFKHYVIASQSQRRLVKALRHSFAISKEVQRKASLSLGGRVIQLPGAPVVNSSGEPFFLKGTRFSRQGNKNPHFNQHRAGLSFVCNGCLPLLVIETPVFWLEF